MEEKGHLGHYVDGLRSLKKKKKKPYYANVYIVLVIYFSTA